MNKRNEVEMPELPWYTVEEGTQWHREAQLVEHVCRVRPAHSPWEDKAVIITDEQICEKSHSSLERLCGHSSLLVMN